MAACCPLQQIDFQTTILSRFDLLFVVRDIREVQKDEVSLSPPPSFWIGRLWGWWCCGGPNPEDYTLSQQYHSQRIAAHVLNIHRNVATQSGPEPDISPDVLRRFVAYARS